MIQPLIEACTKENISKGKSWIVDKMTESPELTKLMSDYLIARASAAHVSFDLRLHLVYLLNDLLHHSKRRGAPAHLQVCLSIGKIGSAGQLFHSSLAPLITHHRGSNPGPSGYKASELVDH
ncbi:unnamed protein product [Trichobilharzia regenti]|nr:unnamed protein product [Trichobilharzia regenti]